MAMTRSQGCCRLLIEERVVVIGVAGLLWFAGCGGRCGSSSNVAGLPLGVVVVGGV